MNKMNPVVHFEMPYEDKQRAADFYAKVFGWQSQMLGPEMGDYVVVSTTEVDEQTQLPKAPGAINGGLFKKTQENQYPSVVISVDNIHEAMEKVKEAGGKIIGGKNPAQPDDIPGVGLYVSFTDSEGNKVGMLQPHDMTQQS